MAKDNRLFVEAVLYRYRAGIPWRDLPERFGDFRVIHTRHTRWSKSGVWQRIFEALVVDADNEYAMIDSTIVCAHQHSVGAKKGMRDAPLSITHKFYLNIEAKLDVNEMHQFAPHDSIAWWSIMSTVEVSTQPRNLVQIME
jgi:transposase